MCYILAAVWLAVFVLSGLSCMVASLTNAQEDGKTALNVVFNYVGARAQARP